ncbi:Putative Holin-X, holin superfamily III [Sulfitobacter brevis]|uniref:Putative Holin-X, holin superfamily III n=1 Tax=Sulfitobacter brevis TaxID=74348 RepID=A0A1I1XX17_9RHOB|nr:phage holin family protein [Sulfitobacter brevis]SFE11926.1 Putative Holin-X, holin superfamily III [Sulfitobacter brevis]
MISLIGQHVQDAASRTAQTAVIGLGAAIAMFIGLGFLTLAAWLFLIAVATPITAALILGGLYFGIGLVALSILSARQRARARAKAVAAQQSASAEGALSKIILAFITGITAGQKSRS